MSDLDLIRRITGADLPLELIAGNRFEDFKKEKPKYVGPRELRSSKGILISENFARCQGISFLDDERQIGALAHNYSTHNPFYFLTGQWSRRDIENPKKIFRNMKRVLAVHVYHEGNYEWPEVWITDALKRTGIERIIHIPIKSEKPGKRFWRDMVQDVREGSIYVFPTDFEFGIKYCPDNTNKKQD